MNTNKKLLESHLNTLDLAMCVEEHGWSPQLEYLFGDELANVGIDIDDNLHIELQLISDTAMEKLFGKKNKKIGPTASNEKSIRILTTIKNKLSTIKKNKTLTLITKPEVSVIDNIDTINEHIKITTSLTSDILSGIRKPITTELQNQIQKMSNSVNVAISKKKLLSIDNICKNVERNINTLELLLPKLYSLGLLAEKMWSHKKYKINSKDKDTRIAMYKLSSIYNKLKQVSSILIRSSSFALSQIQSEDYGKIKDVAFYSEIKQMSSKVKAYITEYGKSHPAKFKKWKFNFTIYDPKIDGGERDDIFVVSYNWYKYAPFDDADGKQCKKFLAGIINNVVTSATKLGWEQSKRNTTIILSKKIDGSIYKIDTYGGDNDGNIIG